MTEYGPHHVDDARLNDSIQIVRSMTFGWRSNILACAFGTHFMFGLVSVLNALGLSFFYYFPRRISLTIIDPRIDLIVWAVSVVCLSVVATLSCKGNGRSYVQAGLAVLAVTLVIALFMNQKGGVLDKTIVYLLFMVATGKFVSLAVSSETVLRQSNRTFISRVLIYSLVYFVAIEVSSGIHYVLRSFDQFTAIGKVDAAIELQFSYASYGLLPWLYVTFLFSWVWGPVVMRLLKKTSFFQLDSKTTFTSHQDLSDLRRHLSILLDYRLFVALVLLHLL